MSRKRTLTARLSAVCLSAVVLLTPSAHALMPHTSQNISLVSGWNAVYVEVSPEQPADELFAFWPVDHVGLYDPASFLATRQFSAEWNSQGLPREAMAVWYRGAPEASTLKSVPAGSILVTFCKDSNGFVDTFRGAPAAPRTTWHVTDTNTVYNFIGFSVTQPTAINAYFEGSPCEEILSRTYYDVIGTNADVAPLAHDVGSETKQVSNGKVLLVPSDTISDWSGVLHVSPMNGIDFGQNADKGLLSIRNDGTTNREVRVQFARPINHGELFGSSELVHYIYVRDMDGAVTNADWHGLYYGTVWHKMLAPSETWNLEFGFYRRYFEDGQPQKGLPFGAILQVTEDSAAHAKVVVPIHGETSGEPLSDWRNGLWVADVELDTVRMVGLTRIVSTNWVTGGVGWVISTNAVPTSLSAAAPTGGKFKLRLPIHRGPDERTRLLQRVVLAGNVTADGTWDYKLYAGSATIPDTARTAMRISAVCLPTEQPVIEAWEDACFWSLESDFGDDGHVAKFAFTVAPNGATSLLRHPYHPQHDGLRWDFQTSAPSGDDVYNYASDVKPETFSVKSEIKLTINHKNGIEEWNPEDTFDGTCEWTFSGLRHDGDIVVSGPMVIKHVSKISQLVLE